MDLLSLKMEGRTTSVIWLVLALLFGVSTMPSCAKPKPPETIIFTAFGGHPFDDYIWTINPDGSNPRILIPPTSQRSCTAASGNSMGRGLVATAQETNPDGTVENHINLYYPMSGTWHRLISQDLLEGEAALALDNMNVAFTAASKSHPEQYRLWITDIHKGEMRKLTDDETGTWDIAPHWNPNSQEIAFLRVRLTPEGLISKLMRVPATGGEAAIILGEEEGVFDFCYAPDGNRLAVWTKRGLEIIEVSTMARQVIMPMEPLTPIYRFMGNSVSWSRTQDKIVYVLTNIQTKQHEMWTVSSTGTNPTNIYTYSERELRSSSFVLQ